MSKKFIITEKEINALLAYLGNKPMVEVEQGVNMLRALPELPEPEKEE